MLLPLLLAAVSVVAAGIAAYGTSAVWVELGSDAGLQLIYFSRRLQWPLLTLCVVSAFGLVVLVVTGRVRAWWLIGLLPVLALFTHRFATSPMRDFRVLDNPPLVSAEAVAWSPANPDGLTDDDYVVGVVLPGVGPAGGGPAAPEGIAYPYALLYRAPMVVQSVREQRVAVLWSAYANFARAYLVDRDLSPREIEVVSQPASATLLYNARYGEFINTVSARTQHARSPTGFRQPLAVTAMTFGRWRSLYPETRVALPPPRSDAAAWRASVPIRPRDMPRVSHGSSRPGQASPTAPGPEPSGPGPAGRSLTETPVIVVGSEPPLALLPSDVSNIPLNLEVGDVPLLVLRDPNTLRIRAFQRRVGGTTLRFALVREPSTRLAVVAGGSSSSIETSTPATGGGWSLRELETSTRWSFRGVCLEPSGPWAGRQLSTIGVFEGAYIEVLQYWMPQLQVHHVTADDFVQLPPEPPAEPPKPATRPTRRQGGGVRR